MSLAIRALKQRMRGWLVGHAPLAYWNYRHWRRGDEEREMCLLPVLCADDRAAVDVGANYGMYSSRLVGLAQRCIAFEPIPAFATMLQDGFGSRLEVHPVALSDTHGGEVELRLPHLFTGYATIEKNNSLDTRDQDRIDLVRVPKATLDSFDLQDVGFMKIDVEGHEGAVLRGARETLKLCSPCILIEVEERHNAGSVLRVLDVVGDLDYATYVIFDGKLCALPEFDLVENQATESLDTYARNMICVPQSRAQDHHDQMLEALNASAAAL